MEPVAVTEEQKTSTTSAVNDSKVTDTVNEDSGLQIAEHSKATWLVGDIVWSKIPGHPWWPSMIAYEPNTAIYYKFCGRVRYYHVQFFGHTPMRGWATEKNIVLYQGKESYQCLKNTSHGKSHKIGTKQLPTWEIAVKMADKAVPMNRHERQLCFTFKYNKGDEHDDRMDGEVKKKIQADNEMFFNEIKKSCNGLFIDPEKSKTSPKTKVKQRNKKSVSTSPLAAGKNKKKKVENGAVKTKSSEHPIAGKRKRGRPRKYKDFVTTEETNQSSSDVETPHSSPPKKKRKYVKKIKSPNEKQAPLLMQKPMKVKTKAKTADNVKQPETVLDIPSDSNSTTSMEIDLKSDTSKPGSKQKESVCVVCEQTDNLIFCEGVCNSAYHVDCLGLNCETPEKFICDECTSGTHTCFICRQTNNVVQCSLSNCGKFYHIDCLDTTKIKVENEKFSCPLHYCVVCGPQQKPNSYRRKLTCCTRCPTAYHSGTCIVAGCLPITSQYLVCKRHFLADKKKAHHSHVNVNWCFVCSMGGTLICCETCPAAFHPECIDVNGIPEGLFYCRDCTTGKELLYGEIVWVKLGMYRWWPAQIYNPNNIPLNIQNLHHQPGEFPVQFLGSHDYYWIHRGRVFSYQEGDKGSCSSGGKYLGNVFRKALEEAKDRYLEWQKLQEEKAEKDLEKLSKKPAAYKHLKVNRYTTATRYVVDESEWSVCECSIDDENPCGPDSHCLNRILLVECSPLKCPAKERCQNQCFVKRQYLDSEPFRTKKCGWGLRAKEAGKKGQFIIEYVGELISEATCRERVHRGVNEGVTNYYMLTIDKDCIIDAGPMANLARFMNHSCDPNCETQKWTVNGEIRVGLFAKRDIEVGEELMFDYQLDCLGNEKKMCSCGSQNCSGFLGVRPKTQHAQQQEEKKKKADLKKKKKKAKKNQVVDVHEDECFNCGDGGELIMCDKTGCSKCYHLVCITLDKKPTGCWICPWHFCDDCGKTASVRCSECSNSFCNVHAVNQIIKSKKGDNWCLEHTNGPDFPPNDNTETEQSTVDSDDLRTDTKKRKKSKVETKSVEISENVNQEDSDSNVEVKKRRRNSQKSDNVGRSKDDETGTVTESSENVIPGDCGIDIGATKAKRTTPMTGDAEQCEPIDSNIASNPTESSEMAHRLSEASTCENNSIDIKPDSRDHPVSPKKSATPDKTTTDPGKATADPDKTTTDPTETTTDPTETTTDPTETTTDPTKNTTDPTKNTAGPTKNTAGPTKNTTDPTKNTTDPTKNTTDPTKNTTDPTKNTTDPTKNTTGPTKNTTDPTKNTTDPTKNTTDPTKNTTDPTKNTTDPTKNTTDPTKNTTDPTKNTTDPTKNTTDPTETTTDPTETTTDPTETTTDPVQTNTGPVETTSSTDITSDSSHDNKHTSDSRNPKMGPREVHATSKQREVTPFSANITEVSNKETKATNVDTSSGKTNDSGNLKVGVGVVDNGNVVVDTPRLTINGSQPSLAQKTTTEVTSGNPTDDLIKDLNKCLMNLVNDIKSEQPPATTTSDVVNYDKNQIPNTNHSPQESKDAKPANIDNNENLGSKSTVNSMNRVQSTPNMNTKSSSENAMIKTTTNSDQDVIVGDSHSGENKSTNTSLDPTSDKMTNIPKKSTSNPLCTNKTKSSIDRSLENNKTQSTVDSAE